MKLRSTLLRVTLLNVALAVGGIMNAQTDITDAALAARPIDTIPDGWTKSGVFNINLTQVNLTNWAAGGFNTVSGIAMFNGAANRKKGRTNWDNSLVLAFGGQQINNGDPVKTDDRIELNSKYGYALKPKWYLAGVFQFKTQFTEGFDADMNRISNFLAPGYTLLGVGAEYRPNDNFSVFLSPATARLVIMNDKKLFGGSTDPELRVYGVKNGSTTEFELGGYIRAMYKTKFSENFTFMTRGDLFSNYLRNPQNMDVTWETLWTLQINKWFAATFNTLLLYDHDTNLTKTDKDDIEYTGPGTQFKQTLGIGLIFNL